MTADKPIPATMKAIRLHAPGGVDNLLYEEVDTPHLAGGEALVRVHAAAVTRDELDWPLDRLPAVPSYELSGVVASVDAGTSVVAIGQAVYALTDFDRNGVAAEYAAVPAELLASKPETLSHIESAAVPLPALSAMQGLFDHGQLQKSQRVLIHGAAGGVGVFAVQLSHLRGAHVIATASGPGVETARMLGADEVINYTTGDLTAIEPVDLVFDTVGSVLLTRSVSLVAPGGRLVSIAEEPPPELCAKHGVEGIYFVVEPNRGQLDELTALIDQGILRVLVDRTYALSNAGEAFKRSLERGKLGKVVITVIADD